MAGAREKKKKNLRKRDEVENLFFWDVGSMKMLCAIKKKRRQRGGGRVFSSGALWPL